MLVRLFLMHGATQHYGKVFGPLTIIILVVLVTPKVGAKESATTMMMVMTLLRKDASCNVVLIQRNTNLHD